MTIDDKENDMTLFNSEQKNLVLQQDKTDPEKLQQDCIVVCEFKIEGMTCVNCSSAIEKGLKNAFENKGLAQDPSKPDNSGVNVVLLMHKMRI